MVVMKRKPKTFQVDLPTGSVIANISVVLVKLLNDPDQARAATSHGYLAVLHFQAVVFAVDLHDICPGRDSHRVVAWRDGELPVYLVSFHNLNRHVRSSAVDLDRALVPLEEHHDRREQDRPACSGESDPFATPGSQIPWTSRGLPVRPVEERRPAAGDGRAIFPATRKPPKPIETAVADPCPATA